MIKNIDHANVIHYGSGSLIFKAATINGISKPYCLKVLNEEFPTPEVRAQLENEFRICSQSGCNSIRKAIRMEKIEEHDALVLDYIDGKDFGKILTSERPDLIQQLNYAIDIAAALGELHKQHIFHQRLHPSNIIIENGTNKVFFIDLGMAMSGNAYGVKNGIEQEQDIEVLKHIAPEQTGRVNRPVDNRTDLYSLGVILYRLFTGAAPFESKDGLELIYAHVAKNPVPPIRINSTLPVPVSDIILKLLEKNAEDRYQSVFGLKMDLEKCLYFLKSAGKIEPFRIAENDFTGRLFVSNKLFGRTKEIDFINQLFKDCASGGKHTLFVSGYSGSGKSALVEELREPVSAKNGFFIKGKFDQIPSDTPYSTFVQAFSELVQILLTGDEQYQVEWKKKINDALGHSGKIITEFIPKLENLIGKHPGLPDLTGIEAQNRFNYEIITFLKTIAGKEHPLVIFVDDLQWADASSLNLLKLISENTDIAYFMLIGTYRGNELGDNPALQKKLNELKDENVHFEEIVLKDLSYNDVSTLVTDSLHTGQDNSPFLADIIYNKTKGNIFYVWQFMRSILEEGFLWFDFDQHRWEWNARMIQEMNVTGNVVELMTSFLKKFPSETYEILKTAACLGNKFDRRSLSIIRQISEKQIADLLSLPLSEGLVIGSAEGEYKFSHDRIQQTIYSLIPAIEKAERHLQNGQRITSHLNQDEIQEKIFELVNQWNLGVELINDPVEKSYLAGLNAIAAQKAFSSAAYPQALSYFEKGLYVMDEADWENNYSLKLEMTTNAADAAYLSGEYEKVGLLVNDLLRHSRSLIDSVRGQETEIKKLIAQNKTLEAVQLGLSILNTLGVKLPIKPGKMRVLKDLLQTKVLLRNKTTEYFDRLPLMKDPEKNAAMRILSDISSAAYFAKPNLVPLLVFKMVSLTVKYGLSRKSPFSFAAFGYILSVYLNETDKGIKFGEIALHLAKMLNAEELTGSILVTNNIFLSHKRKPFAVLQPEMEKAFKSSLEYGDTEYASYAVHNLAYQSLIMGAPLQPLSQKISQLYQQIEKQKQHLTLKRIRIFRQSILNLTELSEHPGRLKGPVFDESEIDITELTKSNEIYFQNLYLQKLYLSLIFNLQKEAEENLAMVERFQESVKGTTLYPLFYFYRSLVICDTLSAAPASIKSLKTVKKDIAVLKKFERLCPVNYTLKRLLLEAEYTSLKGRQEEAKVLYDKALKAGSESGMICDLALCWERAGKFFISTQQGLLANFYLQNAYRLYKRWGAIAKTRQMETHYPQLKSGAPEWLQEQQMETHKPAATNLDLETVMKASGALSGEIVLPRLMKKMMEIILESAGAQSGFLVMEKNGERFIEARISADTDEITIQSIPVKQSGLLAESVINYVYLSKEPVILDDASRSSLFANDEYIRKNRCKSILCVPLINLGKLQAVIYLSNDLIYGAFTENRIALLKLLAGQMATSIENALFYSELENKVVERTIELNNEKKKSDDLLLNILPMEVADELKQTGRTTPRHYEIATVMFTDFENFTVKSEQLNPQELVNIIDTCFKRFDEIITKHRIEKIKTIGDAYLCVSGLPDAKDHSAENVVLAALEIIEALKEIRQNASEKGDFDVRVGIHTGPLVAGVVGDKKFAYDIWGDTVNTAARMEQNSEPNRINISQSTYELIKDKFNCSSRGKRAVKNKGMVEMYFVEGANKSYK